MEHVWIYGYIDSQIVEWAHETETTRISIVFLYSFFSPFKLIYLFIKINFIHSILLIS